MQIDTGHLVSGEKMREMLEEVERLRKEYEGESGEPLGKLEPLEDIKKELEQLEERQKELASYVEVPAELNRAARRKLAGRDEAHVSLTSGGKLSKWAAQQRKAKRKIARASKRRNR